MSYTGYQQISNEQLSKMQNYKIIATIPEDPLYWGDYECALFDDVLDDSEYLDGDRYTIVETYTMYPKGSDIPDGPGIKGNRHLVVFDEFEWRMQKPPHNFQIGDQVRLTARPLNRGKLGRFGPGTRCEVIGFGSGSYDLTLKTIRSGIEFYYHWELVKS